METKLKVDGMTCGNCVKHVTHALEQVAGVTHVDVSLEAGEATIHHDEADVQAMIAAVEEDGYRAKVA